MKTVCGIDFGTSNSTIAVVKRGETTLVPLEDGNTTLPSAILSVKNGLGTLPKALLSAQERLWHFAKSDLGRSEAVCKPEKSAPD